jgi:hypothetical protein
MRQRQHDATEAFESTPDHAGEPYWTRALGGRGAKDRPSLVLHGSSVSSRSDPEPLFDLRLEFANGDRGHASMIASISLMSIGRASAFQRASSVATKKSKRSGQVGRMLAEREGGVVFYRAGIHDAVRIRDAVS